MEDDLDSLRVPYDPDARAEVDRALERMRQKVEFDKMLEQTRFHR